MRKIKNQNVKCKIKEVIPKGFHNFNFLFLIFAFIITGCEQRRKEEVLAIEPNVATLAVAADYATGAIGATGGLDAWTKTKKLSLDCVVTFYSAEGFDGSFYLTEHHFEVYPWSNSIRITAYEPLSKFVWQLSSGQFSVPEGDERFDVARAAVSYRDYAEAALTAITAPVRFLDKSVGFTKVPTPVRMEGLWYYPIERTYQVEQAASSSELKSIPPMDLYWSKVVFFQNKDSSLVDMIWFAKVDLMQFLAVRGYDYKQVEKDGVLVPTKIEIFRSDARAALKERLVKIDFKRLDVNIKNQNVKIKIVEFAEGGQFP